jgi:rifampicin phosphotransferase
VTGTSPGGLAAREAEEALAVRLPVAGSDAALGGKGASLNALLRHGLPVPPTAVVTTGAYRVVASQPPLDELLHRLRSAPPPPPAGREDAVREVDEAFLDVACPEWLEQRILDGTRDLWAAGPVAVRSSATTEDLHGASFAGQYRSVLRMDGGEELF